MSLFKTVWSRVHGFFVGPRLYAGRYRHGDGWHFQLGGTVYWDSAPGFHFDCLGIEISIIRWTFFLHYQDNN